MLRSAVLSNRYLIGQLNSSEESSGGSEIEGIESKSEDAESENDIANTTAFQRDYALVIALSSTIESLTQDDGRQIFQEYDNYRRDPPSSAAISSSLPEPVLQARAQDPGPITSATLAMMPKYKPSNEKFETTDQEMCALLTEWTKTTGTLMGEYLVQPLYDGKSIGNTIEAAQPLDL